MRWIFVLFLLLAPFAAAEEYIFDSSLYATEELLVEIQLDNTIETTGDVRSLETKLLYYPHEFLGQKVGEVDTSPNPVEQNENSLLFRWEQPKGKTTLQYKAEVTSFFHRPEITKKIPFPFRDVPKEAQQYLQSEEIIIITPEIRKTAAQIVGDEEDAVRAVFEIGQWVKNNIEYSLTTVTAEAAQTSQWVLDTRTGVCDELTSLFIAMLRSQGIPARFISGVAYTNLEALDTFWGPHGWAEVYFPGIGWVPYDVTYGQFGFVDATHIAFTSAADATGKAAEYSILSKGGTLDPQGIERTTRLLSKEGRVDEAMPITVATALEDVGFGSYNRIDVTIENPHDHYRSTELFLAKTTGLVIGDRTKSVLLGPEEQKTFHWIVQVENSLEDGFLYTFPILVYTNTNNSYKTKFVAHSSAQVIEEESLILEEERSQVVLEETLSCDHPEQVKREEEFQVVCTYPNTAKLCIEEVCVEGMEVSKTLQFSELGVQNIIVTGEEGANKERTVLTIQILDEPDFTVSIEGSDQIVYSKEEPFFIHVEKTSTAIPKDIVVVLEHPLFSNTWEFENLASPGRIEVRLPGSHLHAGENQITVRAYTQDTEKTDTHTVTPIGEGFSEHLVLWINKLSAAVAKVTPTNNLAGNAVYERITY